MKSRTRSAVPVTLLQDPSNAFRSRANPAGFIPWRIVLAVFLSFIFAAAAIAEPFQLPAIVEPASQERHPGKLIFVELVTPDLAAAKKFYAGLFGWNFQDFQTKGKQYAEALLDGSPVAGLFQRDMPPGAKRQPAWLSFFSVGDVKAARDVALENGAKVLFGPRNLPLRGEEAVLSDPQGAVFAVLKSSSGDPQDFLATPGEWIWCSLITKDPDTGAAFYQKLFDYEVFELPAKPGSQHLLLSSGGYARASVNSLPVNRPEAFPHWLNFIRVVDAVKVAEKAVSLGGRVLVEPHIDRQGGKIAVIADPQGAVFGLLEWPEAENKEVSK